MLGLPLGLHHSLRPDRAGRPAGALFPAADYPAAAPPHIFPALAAHSRPRAEGRDACPHALVDSGLASGHRRARHFRHGRTHSQSAAAGEAGEGPLLIVLDDGWSAAPSWDDRVVAAAQRIETAGRYGRLVAIVATSDAGREILATDASKALERLRAIKPVPYIPDRLASFPAIEKFVAAKPKSALVWVADSVERGNGKAFAQRSSPISASR